VNVTDIISKDLRTISDCELVELGKHYNTPEKLVELKGSLLSFDKEMNNFEVCCLAIYQIKENIETS